MAGAGYKLFNTGDVLTAAQVNTYLNEQTVMVFASSAARTSALSGVLAEGMMSYLQDTNSVEVYNGTAWVSVGGGGGDVTEVQAGTGISVASGTGPIPVVTNTMATAIDAKADLVVGTGADTFSRLGVGANNTVLTADSAEATGLKWAAPAAGSFSGASVYKNNTAQSSNNATTTAVTFDTESFDTDSYHSTASNTSRMTIPSGKDGKFLLLGRVTYVANATGTRQARLLKNGNLIAVNNASSVGSGSGQNIEVSGIFSAVATDYFEVAYWQNSSGSLNSESGGEYYDALFIQYLGA